LRTKNAVKASQLLTALGLQDLYPFDATIML